MKVALVYTSTTPELIELVEKDLCAGRSAHEQRRHSQTAD